MRRAIWNTVKIALAGATIFAIGWSVTVTDSDGEVQEASADIGTWTTTEAMFGGDFAKLAAAGGMQPRQYEMNGNLVHFGVAYVQEDPAEVLDRYQEAFVDAGINKRKFMDVPDGKFTRTLASLSKGAKLTEEEREYNEAMLTGGVVPIETRPDYVAMGGIIPKGHATTVPEIVGDWVANGTETIDRQMDGFRFIDAHQYPGQKGSRVTSVWADEGFDAKKMANPQLAGIRPVLDTPICMGCSVGMQMKSLDPNEKYRIGHFYSNRTSRDVRDFYLRAMGQKGFEIGDAHKAVELARRYLGPQVPPGAVLSYKKGGVEALVTIFDDYKTGETSVVVVESF